MPLLSEQRQDFRILGCKKTKRLITGLYQIGEEQGLGAGGILQQNGIRRRCFAAADSSTFGHNTGKCIRI